MNLRQTFQSIISLHQEEFPYALIQRDLSLPINKGNIITVTGVRRCGKSSLLKLTVNILLESGVPKERILYIGFDDERFDLMETSNFDEILQAYREMYPGQSLKDVYMFFDEIQLIKGWEFFVLRVYKDYCKNIFITGSTAEMISGEMASALRGYPDEYKEQVLSFGEFLRFKSIAVNKYSEEGASVLRKAFKDYCFEGGYPKVVLTEERTEKTKILQSYFNTMLFRDMIEHYRIKSSPAVVRYFLKRVMENLTKPTSVNNIFNELKSVGMKVSKNSLYEWLDYSCQIFLFHRVPEYTQSVVKENALPAKYYVADMGMRNAVLSTQSLDEGKALENIVFKILNGTLGEEDRLFYYKGGKECDFFVQRSGLVSELIQVCWALDETNKERELGGLLEASQRTGCQNCSVMTFDQEENLEYQGLQIAVKAAWR